MSTTTMTTLMPHTGLDRPECFHCGAELPPVGLSGLCAACADLARVQRELDGAKWLALRETAEALLAGDAGRYVPALRAYYRAEDALERRGWADGWAERTEAALAARSGATAASAD